MSNQQTETSNHNEQPVESLIKAFAQKRKKFIDILLSLDDETQKFKSLHQRLNIHMRPVDIAFFTAEHDDHHLASIREIL